MDEPVVQFKNWVRYHSIFTISYMLTSVFLFLSVFFRYLDSTQFLISSKDNLLQSFWKVWPTVAFPGQVIDLNLLEIPKAQAIHFIVKYWAYMTIVYQYNIVRNAETEMFLDPFRRQSKGHFYWFIILTFIILTALYILGIYDFSMESLMSILLFSWYKDRPNARTDIFFAFPVTRKQYTIGIVILRLLIIGQNYNMQVPIWKLVFSGFIFQYYVLPFTFVMFYSFVRNFIATKYQIDLFKPPKILQLLKINSVFVFFKKNNEEKKQDRMQTIDKLNFNTT